MHMNVITYISTLDTFKKGNVCLNAHAVWQPLGILRPMSKFLKQQCHWRPNKQSKIYITKKIF